MKNTKVNPILCKVTTTLWFPTLSESASIRSRISRAVKMGGMDPDRITIDILKKTEGGVSNLLLFQVKACRSILHHGGGSIGLKKGTYRIFLTDKDIGVFAYSNRNDKVFYSLYSFLGKVDKKSSTIDIRQEVCLEDIEHEPYKGTWYSIILLRDPLMKGEKDIICISSLSNTSWLYRVSPNGLRSLPLEEQELV